MRIFLTVALLLCPFAGAQEIHDHAAPEQLGDVSFPISCQPEVQKEFNRAVALLHSFAYTMAETAFRAAAEHDPRCAMAHWGIAMTSFHQLWQPPIAPAAYLPAQRKIDESLRIGAVTERERKFIRAAALVFRGADSVPYEARALRYEQAMADLAGENRQDTEAQVFYALALLANASPADKTHARQKQAVALLEPLFRSFPQHPGIAHYLIHACDNSELATEGLPAARLYSKIAPSVPHALHMPSHIFTRLGLWEDSIASNLAARDAAHRVRDAGEELHAMDYLVYAYLQLGRDTDAAQVIQQLKTMPSLDVGDFKIAYASTVMPIRYAVERGRWGDATVITPPVGAPPPVTALAFWAKGIGLARTGHSAEARKAADELHRIETQLYASANDYRATEVGVMRREIMAWSARAENQNDAAVQLMREAADEEDSVEKLPVTPGPIIPAREQLGDLLLVQGHPGLAAHEFKVALSDAPGRRRAIRGLEEAAEHSPPK